MTDALSEPMYFAMESETNHGDIDEMDFHKINGTYFRCYDSYCITPMEHALMTNKKVMFDMLWHRLGFMNINESNVSQQLLSTKKIGTIPYPRKPTRLYTRNHRKFSNKLWRFPR